MLDLRWVVANLEEAKTRLALRGENASRALAPIEELASERKALILATETQRAEQKKKSEEMRTLKGDAQAARDLIALVSAKTIERAKDLESKFEEAATERVAEGRRLLEAGKLDEARPILEDASVAFAKLDCGKEAKELLKKCKHAADG